jgi:hypothetical protein
LCQPAGYKGHRGIPTSATLRTAGYQPSSTTTAVAFREYYDLRADPWELRNLLADTDPHNDPDVDGLSARLRQAEQCAGTTGPNPCP